MHLAIIFCLRQETCIMRRKKLRGHKRIWTAIEKWKQESLLFDLEYILKGSSRCYEKISIHPWSGYTTLNSKTSEPKGTTKKKIVEAFIDIYGNWKTQLDKIGQPYYLKIWLYEPRFSKSQIVCAVGNFIDFYETTFYKPEVSVAFNMANYEKVKDHLASFIWNNYLDEDHYDNTSLDERDSYETPQEYLKTKAWFEKQLLRTHRHIKLEEPNGKVTDLYSCKRGIVWIGCK